jgi:hypothetical protein
MRFLRPIEFAWLRAGRRLAVQGGFEPVLDHPLASPMEGGDTNIERVGDLPVTPAWAIDIGLQ